MYTGRHATAKMKTASPHLAATANVDLDVNLRFYYGSVKRSRAAYLPAQGQGTKSKKPLACDG